MAESRFKKLQHEVAAGYEKKGVPPKQAEEIGAKVAAKVGRAKLGAAEMKRRAVKGRKKQA